MRIVATEQRISARATALDEREPFAGLHFKLNVGIAGHEDDLHLRVQLQDSFHQSGYAFANHLRCLDRGAFTNGTPEETTGDAELDCSAVSAAGAAAGLNQGKRKMA